MYNYDVHIQLINKLRSSGELELLRDARERMSSVFPLTPQLWLEWVADEKQLATNNDDKLKIIELFERAIGDYTSIDVWFEYVQYSIGLMSISSFGIDGVRKVFENALTNVGLHVSKGNSIWEAFREFENAILEMTPINDPENLSDEFKNQINRVFDIFKRQLSLPLYNMEKTYEEFEQWCAGIKETYGIELNLAVIKPNYEKALSQLQILKSYEESLQVSEFPHLEQYFRYIEYEELKGTPQRVQCIYERAIVDNCLVSDLWVKYTRYQDKKVVVDSLIIPIYQRAVRNCPWCSTLWASYIMSLERLKAPHETILNIFETALQAGFQLGSDYKEVWLTYLNYMRRKTNWSDEKDVKSLRKTFEKASEHLANYPDGDPNCSIIQYLAKIEAKFCKNINAARELLHNLFNSRSDIASQAQSWIDFANLERVYGDEKHYRKVLMRGLSLANDWPESIGQLLITYEKEESDSIEGYDEVLNKYEDVMKRITEKRRINAEKEKESRKQQKVQKKQEKYELKRSLKRKNEDAEKGQWETTSEKVFKHDDFKKPKERHEENFESTKSKQRKVESKEKEEMKKDDIKNVQPAHGISYKSDGTRDLQTVFLSNLDFSVTEDEIREIFSKFGQIDDLRLVRNYKGLSKGYCYVEYSSIQGAKEALKHDRMAIGNRPVFISEINKKKSFQYSNSLEKNKLFVSNLSPTTTKEDLHKVFDKIGCLKDIRVVTFRNGHSKGNAYVEYEDEISANEAVNKLDGTLIDGRNIKVAISNPVASKNEQKKDFKDTSILGGGITGTSGM